MAIAFSTNPSEAVGMLSNQLTSSGTYSVPSDIVLTIKNTYHLSIQCPLLLIINQFGRRKGQLLFSFFC